MRNLTLIAVGVSTLALSGCSLFDGLSSKNNTYNNAQSSHTGGSYNPAHAQGCCVGGSSLSKWNLEADVGPEWITGGKAFAGGKVATNFPGQTLNDIDMNDAYSQARRVTLGGSYALNPNRKITASVNHFKAEGNRRQLGLQDTTSTLGTLSDYEGYGIEAGLRQYMQPNMIGNKFGYRPYVEGRIGAQNVEDISMTYFQNVPTNGTTTVDMYDGGWVPTGAALIGVETPVFKRGTVALETGIRYAGTLDASDNLATQAPNFAGAANGADRWSVPITLRGRYRF